MAQFLIVAKADGLDEYRKIADEYGVGFEYNDFYMPDLLDDNLKLQSVMDRYRTAGVPEYCTMHGAFFDIIPFSNDSAIRRVSLERMKESMEIAEKMGARGVVFHTNCYPMLYSEMYNKGVIDGIVSALKNLLETYRNIDIYLENMFDGNPDIMKAISEQLSEYVNYGVCLDYSHAIISGTDIDIWVETLHPYIRHVHINDNDLKSDLHLAVGDGKIDWDGFKKYYKKYFTGCSILIETTNSDNQIKSLEYLTKIGIFKEENNEQGK